MTMRNTTTMRKAIMVCCTCALLLAACGESYEETKRIARQSRREMMRLDSAALKIAVMPTLDCLPLFVAGYYELLDTAHGGVRLKMFKAQIDVDSALERHRVELAATDLVRTTMMEGRGAKLRLMAPTPAHWQLIANRGSRIKQLKQLDDKMVAMTRLSATDLLTDYVVDSVKLDPDRVFKVQINDLGVRLLMLQNNEMDAQWMPEPYATAARMMHNNVVYDTQRQDIRLGVLALRDDGEMQQQGRKRQIVLLRKAWNQACDSINKYGVRRYLDIIRGWNGVKASMLDSLPDRIRYEHAGEPRESDKTMAAEWVKRIKEKQRKLRQ